MATHRHQSRLNAQARKRAYRRVRGSSRVSDRHAQPWASRPSLVRELLLATFTIEDYASVRSAKASNVSTEVTVGVSSRACGKGHIVGLPHVLSMVLAQVHSGVVPTPR